MLKTRAATLLTLAAAISLAMPAMAQPQKPADIYQAYAQMLEKAGKISLTQEQFTKIRGGYYSVITPEVTTSPAFAKKLGQTSYRYPLAFLKSKPFYRPTIEKLIHSTNMLNRLLAYMTVASADDSSFNKDLWKAAKTETDHDALYWVGTALLYLKDPNTSALFDFLVKNEDFGDAHMIPLMLDQNKQSLQQTCYAKIDSSDMKAKVLAVQLLSTTGLNPRTDEAIRKTFKSLEGTPKGFAISAMATLHMGNLKELLEPELQNKNLRSVALHALAASPTAADRDCIDTCIPAQGEVPADVLMVLMRSTNVDMVRKFLILVRDRPVPAKFEHRMMMSSSQLMESDALLPQLKDTIRRTKNRQLVPYLSLSLAKRTDSESVSLRVPLWNK